MTNRTCTCTTLRTTTSLAVLLLVAHCTIGCGGDENAGHEESLTDACSGTYQCTGAGEPVTTTLSKHDGVCFAGSVPLGEDGHAAMPGGDVYWTGDTEVWFVAFVGGSAHETMRCARNQPSMAATQGGCHGAPSRCDSRIVANSCLGGCHLSSRYVVDRWYNDCVGTPEPCEESADRYWCEQKGCSWSE